MLREATSASLVNPARTGAGEMFAILFALAIEALPTLRRLRDRRPLRLAHSWAYVATLDGRQVLVAVVGATGEQRAGRAAIEVIEQHSPSAIVSAGFAGALRDDLAVSDLVLPQSVCNEQREEIPLAPWAIESESFPAMEQRGRLVSVSHFIGDVAEKRALAAQHAALACDMETWAVANACRQSGTPFYSLRIISDRLTDEFPRELPQLLAAQSSSRQVLVAAGAVLRRPALARELWRLERSARRVAAKLADHLTPLVRLIPSTPRVDR